MNVVLVKDGVTFPAVVGDYVGKIAPGGLWLLSAIVQTAVEIGHDITITSGSDGCHSGEFDPHHKAEAYDIRTHDLPDKEQALAVLQKYHGPLFYSFIEDLGTENEHIHCQVKKGTVFPPQ